MEAIHEWLLASVFATSRRLSTTSVLSVAGELLDQSLNAISCSILSSQIVEDLNILLWTTTFCSKTSKANQRVLVVDDDLGLQNLFRTFLKQIGFSRVVVGTG